MHHSPVIQLHHTPRHSFLTRMATIRIPEGTTFEIERDTCTALHATSGEPCTPTSTVGPQPSHHLTLHDSPCPSMLAARDTAALAIRRRDAEQAVIDRDAALFAAEHAARLAAQDAALGGGGQEVGPDEAMHHEAGDAEGQAEEDVAAADGGEELLDYDDEEEQALMEAE